VFRRWLAGWRTRRTGGARGSRIESGHRCKGRHLPCHHRLDERGNKPRPMGTARTAGRLGALVPVPRWKVMIRLPAGATTASGMLCRAIERRLRLTARRLSCRSCVSTVAVLLLFESSLFPFTPPPFTNSPGRSFFVPVVTACAVLAISDRWESAIRILAASKHLAELHCSSANRTPAACPPPASLLLLPQSP